MSEVIIPKKVLWVIYEFLQPILLTIIGFLVGVVLWFCTKVYEKVDSIADILQNERINNKAIQVKQEEFASFKQEANIKLSKYDSKLEELQIKVAELRAN